jgi:PAS domain S-box-containing protein
VNSAPQAEGAAENLQAPDPAGVDPFDELPLPYIEIDAHGIITRANRATLALHNLGCGQLIGKMAWDMVAMDEKDMSFAAYCTSLETGEAATVVRRSLYDRSGQFRCYEMHRSLVRDVHGNPAGMRMLCVDVTEAKKALEEARGAILYLRSVLNSICEALVVTDSVGFIHSLNPAAEKLLGGEVSELTGMAIEEGLPIVAYLSGEQTELTFAMLLEGPSNGMATILDRAGHAIRVGIGTAPVLDQENGSTMGAVLVLRKLEIPR